MRDYAILVLFIVGVLVTGAAITAIKLNVEDAQGAPQPQMASPEIVTITASDVENRAARTLEIGIEGSDTPVNLSQLYVTVTSSSGTGTYRLP